MQTKPLPAILQNLRLPIIASPMFILSYPELVKAQCKSGIVGSFPALNARKEGQLNEWLTQIKQELQDFQNANPTQKVAPFAVNQIVHASNPRLATDIQVCVDHEVPIIITSLRAPPKELIDGVHSYGGIILHDVINMKHAMKALESGVDGLILVAAGAGGHAGTTSPFALVSEIREKFDGLIVLSGAMSTGASVLAAQAMGADLAYMGTRFIATHEANASDLYKNCVVESTMDDVVYSNYFSGIHGNYLKKSIIRAGMDPDNLPQADKSKMDFGKESSPEGAKAWKDIWGAGHGVGTIHQIDSVANIVSQIAIEYEAAKQRLARIAV